MIDKHEQAIYYELLDMRTGVTQRVIAVYALNTVEQRRQLWQFIQRSCLTTNCPILIGGDFNNVLYAEDRLQGNMVTESEVQDFAECIQHNELSEIRAVGNRYTWCNNQDGHARIHSNIDRCLANNQWFRVFNQVIVERLERSISDHLPQMLNFMDGTGNRKPPFKFLNVLADHPEFERIVRSECSINGPRNKLLNIWFNLKRLKQPLKQLNTRVFKRTTERVEQIREQLQDVQKQMIDGMEDGVIIPRERELIQELEKWSGIEEKIWQQKSRIDWLKMGDANTKFFHAYTKARQSANAIKVLIRADGSRCTT